MSEEYPCPEDCGYVGDSKIALKRHYGRAHEGSLAETYEKVCPECGDSFEVKPRHKDQTHCSTECYAEARRERVELTCEYCDDAFELRPKEAEGRRFCSWPCRRRAETVRLECEHCGGAFSVPPYQSDRRFCSRECTQAHQRQAAATVETRACAGCGYHFQADRDQNHCSPACWNELQRAAENRPRSIDSLLENLYVELDFNLRDTHKRLNTALNHGDYSEDYISKPDVRDRLQDLGLWDCRLSYYKAAVAAGEDADQEDDGTDDSWREYYQPEEVAGDD